jgi:hypothetical protein
MKVRFFPLFVILVIGCVSCASNKTSSFEGSDDFMTDDSGGASVPLGNIDVGLTGAFSSAVTRQSAAAVYDGANNVVTLEFLSAAVHNRQYWTAGARETFIKALAQYEVDYEARNLPTGFLGSGKHNVYGKAEITIHWWSMSFSKHSRGVSRLDFGYRFKSRNPYFTVTQSGAKDTYVNLESNSAQVTMYFTRAMAQELAALFDEENLYAVQNRR